MQWCYHVYIFVDSASNHKIHTNFNPSKLNTLGVSVLELKLLHGKLNSLNLPFYVAPNFHDLNFLLCVFLEFDYP